MFKVFLIAAVSFSCFVLISGVTHAPFRFITVNFLGKILNRLARRKQKEKQRQKKKAVE